MTYFRKWQGVNHPPSVIVAGCGLWSIVASNGSEVATTEYAVNLTHLVRSINILSEKKTKVLWTLQEPVIVDRLPPEYSAVTNEQLDLYNKAAVEV